MSKIIINHSPQEIRIAILEDRNLVRVFYERTRNRSSVHKIYKGKVLKVLPGMECAFVDIGLAKAAFLFVDDVRTDHFRREEDDETLAEKREESVAKKKLPDENQTTDPEKNERVKIENLLKEKQEILVQVVKGPIGTKGARVTCNITIPGRNLVLTPYSKGVSVSRQILMGKERSRLKQIVQEHKPENLGFIIRTVAQRRPDDEIVGDIRYLTEIWQQNEEKYSKLKAPGLLYGDLNLTYRMLRDRISDNIEELVIDSPSEFKKIKQYVDTYLPSYSGLPTLYNRRTNIFDYYGINAEIDRALGKKVYLFSGGYLVIDQTEALTTIDINTGSFIGSTNHEETILKTNMEAIVELVKQIRVRDLGGIIIIDFIDMEQLENREQVFSSLKNELKKDKAKTKILQISEIGLVEMTRKRSRENLDNFLRIHCPYCQGSGKIKSIETTVYDIYRDMFRLIKSRETGKKLIIGVHPDIYDFIEYNETETISAMEREYNMTFSFKPNVTFHHEQYDIFELP